MTYYILPKNKINYNLNLRINNNELDLLICYSLYNYKNNINNQLKQIVSLDLEYINKIINPFEFIVTEVPGTKSSVCKIVVESNFFFELYEIIKQSNIISNNLILKNINIVCFTNNILSCNSLLNFLNNDESKCLINDSFNFSKIYNDFILNKNKNLNVNINILIIEFNDLDYNNINLYIKNLLLVLLLILKYKNNYKSNKCLTIFKLKNILYKPIIDIIYIITTLFDKVELCKPLISNIMNDNSYLICNNLYINNDIRNDLFNIIHSFIIRIIDLNDNCNNLKIHSLLDNKIPNILIKRIEEYNIIIGQQYLESNNQIINILNCKNSFDKIESLKRNHIQKCIQWCEKNNFECNKFIDKTNMFYSNDKIIIRNLVDNIIKKIIDNR